MWQVRCGNADTSVSDFSDREAVGISKGGGDTALCRGVLHGVVDENQEETLEGVGVNPPVALRVSITRGAAATIAGQS